MEKIKEQLTVNLSCGHSLVFTGHIPKSVLSGIYKNLHYYCHLHEIEAQIEQINYKKDKKTAQYTSHPLDLFSNNAARTSYDVIKMNETPAISRKHEFNSPDFL